MAVVVKGAFAGPGAAVNTSSHQGVWRREILCTEVRILEWSPNLAKFGNHGEGLYYASQFHIYRVDLLMPLLA